VNIQQAAQFIVNKIRGQTTGHIEAVRKNWRYLNLSHGEIKTLAQEGLLYAHIRKPLNGSRDLEYAGLVVDPGLPPPPSVDILLIVSYKMQDGVTRVFNDWTREDCSFTQRRFRSQIIGISNKVAVLETAKTLLRKYQKNRIGDLPEDAREKLRADWQGGPT
jgi:hypothetical protein